MGYHSEASSSDSQSCSLGAETGALDEQNGSNGGGYEGDHQLGPRPQGPEPDGFGQFNNEEGAQSAQQQVHTCSDLQCGATSTVQADVRPRRGTDVQTVGRTDGRVVREHFVEPAQLGEQAGVVIGNGPVGGALKRKIVSVQRVLVELRVGVKVTVDER